MIFAVHNSKNENTIDTHLNKYFSTQYVGLLLYMYDMYLLLLLVVVMRVVVGRERREGGGEGEVNGVTAAVAAAVTVVTSGLDSVIVGWDGEATEV